MQTAALRGTRILRQGETLRRANNLVKVQVALVMVNRPTEWLSVCLCSSIHVLLVPTS